MRARLPLVGLALALALTAACSGRTYHGPSLHLDGVDDHAIVGRVEARDPLALADSPFTVSAWFLQEPGGDPYARILDKSDGPFGHAGWALGADAASGQIHLYANHGDVGGDFVTRRDAYAPGRWHHVAAVARHDHHEIWIDGRRARGASFEDGRHALPAAAASEMRIGTWNHADGREWRGSLGEMAVWRRDLRGDEIAALAAAEGRRDVREVVSPEGLVGYWRPAASGDVIPDLSPTGAHARIVRGR